MIRLAIFVTSAALLTTGCGHGLEAPAVGQVNDAGQPVADAPQPNEAPAPEEVKQREAAKTEIVRALLEALDEEPGDSQEVKNEVTQMLLNADEELAGVLGDNRKRLILQANRKLQLPIIGEPPRPAAEPKAQPPAKTVPPGKPPLASKPGEPQTDLVKALLDVLDQAEADDAEVKDELRNSLLEADVQLREILGDNAKRLILRVNQKPPAPIVAGPGPPEGELKKTR
ncbi:MAG: hypothetical protein ACYTG0_03185 [Planctomycetota bacterium]